MRRGTRSCARRGVRGDATRTQDAAGSRLRRVLADERFRSGDVTTDFVEEFLAGEAAAAA